jgi:hypothetical protein
MALSGCSSPEEIVSIAPTLACQEEVNCHIYTWRIGIRYGPNIAGYHIDCRCQHRNPDGTVRFGEERS